MGEKAVGRLILAVVWGVVGILLFGIVVLTAASTSLAPAENGVWWAWGERFEVEDPRVFAFVPELATALVIVVGGYVAWRRVKAADLQAATARRQVDEQIEATRVASRTADAATEQARVARASLVTEQFAKAIEQISSDKLMERVGGIHTLERLAHDDQPGGGEDEIDEGSLAVTVTHVLFGHLRELVGPTEDSEREVSEVERSTLVRALARLPAGATGYIDAPGINLKGADLRNMGLAGAKLVGANLAVANLTAANLDGANLTVANLSGASLAVANLTGAKLAGADLTDADLANANLGHAKLAGADLTNANLTGADLTDANLGNANLRGADLTNANLFGADLRGADLTDADLEDANLEDAKLDSTIGLPDEDRL